MPGPATERRADSRSIPETRLFPLAGGRPGHPEVDRWFGLDASERRVLARRWFDEMRRAGPNVLVLLHDGHPTACAGPLAFGYVAVYRHHVNVGFFLGTSLADPAGLLEGSGRYMRHVKVRPEARIQEAALQDLIRQAWADMHARLPAR